ncbi:MAG TPA: peptidylprolyl isomerase [Kofleriaceae bacterium]|nr:peptidylprolyl isomerase [Kofleriaceae bacterium]
MAGPGRCWLLLILVLAACGSPRPVAPPVAAAPPPELSEIPGLEAAREARTGRLIALSRSANGVVRERAVRGLARIGDDAALAALGELARSADAGVQAAAVWGLGISGGGDGAAAREAALLRLHGSMTADAGRVVVLEALGRIGSAASLPVLAAALSDGAPTVRVVAGLAVGVFGRRSIAVDDRVRAALYASGDHVDPGVRYAVAYALGREHEPPQSGPVADRARAVLGRLATDADAETRTQALAGLARRDEAGPSAFVAALADVDWRVRLQAVQALTADRFGVDGRAAVAEALVREWGLVFASSEGSTSAHVLGDGLRALRSRGSEAPVLAAAIALVDDAAVRLASDELAPADRLIASMVHCRGLAVVIARARGDGSSGERLERLRACGGKQRQGWPRHARKALLAEVLALGAAIEHGERRAGLEELAVDTDPRVRAAVLGHALTLARADPSWDEPVKRWLAAGIADAEIEVAGTAADGIAGAVKDAGLDARGYAPLGAALIDRARRGAGDVELALTFLAAIRDAGLAAGVGVCRAAAADGNRSVRELARACVSVISGADPGPAMSVRATVTPEVDPVALLGARVAWRLRTSRGDLEIALDPDRAPWHVAVLVKLTRAGFYDGLMWHRVAAGFVVQGGAPGDSAWGGPGFVIPGEPSPGRYQRGTVGIADAGRDTGGSQIFLMHARAPHLEGRYTIVGTVTRGMDVADRLLVGDRILEATVVVE